MDGKKSQNASDRKGLLSVGCILEQLELLEMLESHIAANAPTAEAARDLAAHRKIESMQAPPPSLARLPPPNLPKSGALQLRPPAYLLYSKAYL